MRDREGTALLAVGLGIGILLAPGIVVVVALFARFTMNGLDPTDTTPSLPVKLCATLGDRGWT